MVQKLAPEVFGLISKNKMPVTAVSFKLLGTFAAPVYQRACNVHFPNLQDMFVMVRAFLGIILDIWTKTKIAAVGVSLTVFLQNTKSANISKTVRDRAISSEFLTRSVVQEYQVAI